MGNRIRIRQLDRGSGMDFGESEGGVCRGFLRR